MKMLVKMGNMRSRSDGEYRGIVNSLLACYSDPPNTETAFPSSPCLLAVFEKHLKKKKELL